MPSNHLFVLKGAHYILKLQDSNILRRLHADESYATTSNRKRSNSAAGLNCVMYSTACLLHCVISHVLGCLSEIHLKKSVQSSMQVFQKKS